MLISDSISPVSIWLLGSDKGAVISYMMALSLKKSDVPLCKNPYVIFVYMFTGFPSQQPLPGLEFLAMLWCTILVQRWPEVQNFESLTFSSNKSKSFS